MASGISGNGSGNTTTFIMTDGEPHNTEYLKHTQITIKNMLERLRCVFLETDSDKNLAMRAAKRLRLATNILLASTNGTHPVVNKTKIDHVCILISAAHREIKKLENRQITAV